MCSSILGAIPNGAGPMVELFFFLQGHPRLLILGSVPKNMRD